MDKIVDLLKAYAIFFNECLSAYVDKTDHWHISAVIALPVFAIYGLSFLLPPIVFALIISAVSFPFLWMISMMPEHSVRRRRTPRG